MYNAFCRFNIFICVIFSFFCLVTTLHGNDIDHLQEFVEAKINFAKTQDEEFEALFEVIQVLNNSGFDIKNHPEIVENVYAILYEQGIKISNEDFLNLKSYIISRVSQSSESNYNFSRHPSSPRASASKI